MKFLHMSDLHLGRKIRNFSFIEDQRHILEEICKVIEEEDPDGVIIAGDIYHTGVPPTDAIDLFDTFLEWLYRHGQKVFIISGNHDTLERMAVGRSVMAAGNIHISKAYNGVIEPIPMEDEYGPLYVYLLPFFKPGQVSDFYKEEVEALEKGDAEGNTQSNAYRVAVEKMHIDPSVRNVLVAHLSVTGANHLESEEQGNSIGGEENVDASVFEGFDFVALGHLHTYQSIGTPRIHYSGSPLKYSFDKTKCRRGVSVIELGEKGHLPTVRPVYCEPLRDMAELKGTYLELTDRSFYEGTNYETDYVSIVLTDEEDVPDAQAKLQIIYKRLVELRYDNKRTRNMPEMNLSNEQEHKNPMEVFAEFYKKMNGKEMDEKRTAIISELIKEIWEANE